MHCGVVRQAVEIKRLNTKDSMRTGDVGLTRFRFVYNAEYMRTDQIIVIREGRTKVFGYVTCLISDKQLQLEAPT
jgi:GTPase